MFVDPQKLLSGLGDAMRRTRSEYHLTLGKVIEALKSEDSSLAVVLSDNLGQGPGEPMSYRGYYSDLAFNPDAPSTVGAFLAVCSDALGKTFEGYKGGDNLMEDDTPLWISPYGESSSRAIVGHAVIDGKFVLLIKQVDD